MDITGNRNNITIKLSCSDVKKLAEGIFQKQMTDNQVKFIMESILEKVVENQGINNSMIEDVIKSIFKK